MDPNQGTLSVSLEEPAPGHVAPPAETPATPPAAPDPPPAPTTPDEAEPEGTIGTPDGQKFVPLAALQAERGKRKTAVSAKDQEIATLRDKAQRYDEASGYLQQARPYIEALRTNPGLVQQIQRPQPPPSEPQGPLTPQEAEEYAKDFDLYTTDGKPDIVRAQRIAARQEKLAERKAQQMVTPLVQTEAHRQASALYQQQLQQPEINGFKIDPKFLNEAWSVVPPEMIAANPAVAEIMKYVAAGRQALSGQKPMPVAPPPPVPTEGAGGGQPSPQSLNTTSEKFASASGMKRDQFLETRNRYTPGQNNSLE